MTTLRLTPAAVATLLLLAGCRGGRSPAVAPPAGPGGADRPPKSAPPSATAAALVARAERLITAGDYGSAGPVLEEALAADPTDRAALRLTAQLTQRQAQELPRPESSPLYLRSARAARTLRANHPDLTREEGQLLAVALYNEACALALGGESARAIEALTDAFEAGFESAEQIDSDADLDPLRKLPKFQEFLRRVERKRVDDLMARFPPGGGAFDFRLTDLDGKTVSPAAFRGKVVVLNVWGVWCTPARKEVPHLVELSRRYRARGLEVVGVSGEGESAEEARKAVREFARDHGITYPCLVGDLSAREKVPGWGGYPTTLFLDREGKVRLVMTGYQPYTALEAAVNALLGEARPETAAARRPPA